MFERFNDSASRAVVTAQDVARVRQCIAIEPVHLLYGSLAWNSIASESMRQLGLDPAKLMIDLLRKGLTGPRLAKSGLTHVPFTTPAKKVLEFALREALELGNNYVGSEHVMLGAMRSPDKTVQEFMGLHQLSKSALRNVVVRLQHHYRQPSYGQQEILFDIDLQRPHVE